MHAKSSGLLDCLGGGKEEEGGMGGMYGRSEKVRAQGSTTIALVGYLALTTDASSVVCLLPICSRI